MSSKMNKKKNNSNKQNMGKYAKKPQNKKTRKKKRQSELIKWKETDNGNNLTLMWQP